jgi:hypothetical protein
MKTIQTKPDTFIIGETWMHIKSESKWKICFLTTYTIGVKDVLFGCFMDMDKEKFMIDFKEIKK